MLYRLYARYFARSLSHLSSVSTASLQSAGGPVGRPNDGAEAAATRQARIACPCWLFHLERPPLLFAAAAAAAAAVSAVTSRQ